MRRIIKKIGGDRIGSGGKMAVTAHGYGYSTHDVSKVRRISMSFGTIVPMYTWLMTSGSRMRMRLDALITSNALLYQLYGSAKFQLDVFSARVALYNPKMQLNLNDQGYEIEDIKFPQLRLTTKPLLTTENISNIQINPSSLLRCIGISSNGQNATTIDAPVTREHNAMQLLMYYQTVKEYYANKQEKIGYIIHNIAINKTITDVTISNDNFVTTETVEEQSSGGAAAAWQTVTTTVMKFIYVGEKPEFADIKIIMSDTENTLDQMFDNLTYEYVGGYTYIQALDIKDEWLNRYINWWEYIEVSDLGKPNLVQYDLKAIDRMMMNIMSQVESETALIIDENTELPYGASFRITDDFYSINTTQEGLALGCYQSDVFNNWLDNATINSLTNRSKIKVNAEGEFTIDMLNLTQKMYNYDMRIGITDGTLDEWREMTYAQLGKSKSIKPVYEGGLSKEIVFDMVVSTAATDEEPLGSIASRGQFGNKHKGGYVQIEADEEKLVAVYAKITPRLVYNQGNDWTTNLKSLNDLHKPAMDKIGYQNLLTDQMAAFETRVAADGVTLTTFTAGKQPAWQWYRTNYDDALGNMADTEDYKVFGRTYEAVKMGGFYRIKDLTTTIDPTKFNDVFAIASLDAMNFDVQVGIDAKLTLVMSEEVIPNL